jgi:hypothetical protein
MSIVTGAAAVILAILAVVFAIALIAMPFLVWQMHSDIKELALDISALRDVHPPQPLFDQESIEQQLAEIQQSLDSIEAILVKALPDNMSDDDLDFPPLPPQQIATAPASPATDHAAPLPSPPMPPDHT